MMHPFLFRGFLVELVGKDLRLLRMIFFHDKGFMMMDVEKELLKFYA